MILSDREIGAALHHGFIKIFPEPPRENWTSTAVDLTLHRNAVTWNPPQRHPSGQPQKLYPAQEGFDIAGMMEDRRYTTTFDIGSAGYDLGPHQFLLGFTAEKIYLPNHSRIAARVEGKSSLARLGVGVHVTAPTIHAGFGLSAKNVNDPGSPIQLEIFNLGNQIVVLEVGMKICQLILEEVREVPVKAYGGAFGGQRHFDLGSQS